MLELRGKEESLMDAGRVGSPLLKAVPELSHTSSVHKEGFEDLGVVGCRKIQQDEMVPELQLLEEMF